jgi:hypothetical protein
VKRTRRRTAARIKALIAKVHQELGDSAYRLSGDMRAK